LNCTVCNLWFVETNILNIKGEKRMAVHALVMGLGGTGAHIMIYLRLTAGDKI
jgi:hypothetical protein